MAIAEKSPLPVGDTTSLSFIYTETGNPVPADKKLDISVLGGSDGENGYLTAGGITDISLSGASQPIQYIAPLSIAGDSLVVPIRASLSVGGGIPMKIQKYDSVKTTSAKINKMMSRTMNECEIGSVTVKNNQPCADAPQCIGPSNPPPAIQVVTQPNGFGEIDICDSGNLGGFKPISPTESDKFIQPITIVPCYDPNTNKLKFSIDGGKIQLNVILDLCYSNINALRNKLVNDWSEINPSDSCDALQDLKNHYKYPVNVTRKEGYMFANILFMHERQHELDFTDIVINKWSQTAKIFSEFEKECNLITSIDKEQKKQDKKIKKLIHDIVNSMMEDWHNKVGVKGSPKNDKYEQDLHGGWFMVGFIRGQIEELQAKYKCP